MLFQKEVFGIALWRPNFSAARIVSLMFSSRVEPISSSIVRWLCGIEHFFRRENWLNYLILLNPVISWISSRNRIRWHICRHAYSCCLVSYLPFPSWKYIQLSYVTPLNHWQLGLGWCVVCFNNQFLRPGHYTRPAQTCFSLAHLF